MKYDVIIVGAGPAGIFSALELSSKTDLSILMLEKGANINAVSYTHLTLPTKRIV